MNFHFLERFLSAIKSSQLNMSYRFSIVSSRNFVIFSQISHGLFGSLLTTVSNYNLNLNISYEIINHLRIN